eukprot:13236259-Alexandrium_andersonii.AAC.1
MAPNFTFSGDQSNGLLISRQCIMRRPLRRQASPLVDPLARMRPAKSAYACIDSLALASWQAMN